ncbi:lipopolysaccharide biosynthesis protein [Massilia sp. MB5]|uniref:lipopolysaccharide biosynthesis protein n=1 Tax=unclassified Massilia TaxID=2609279 RepID=UPI0009E18BB2|nr:MULTISPECIES: lipopolysaccharide biosynthesis protein [unclassified Massilia]UMR32075.1 lipopolysaccharide biosynthesis protein [Massilia sp. MB5]
MTLKSEVLHGLKWMAGAKFGSQMITWVITIFVMRLLVPADYGLMAMSSVFIALLVMFAEVGLGPALVQAAEVTTQKLRQAFGIFLIVNLALCALLNLAAPAIAEFYSEPRLVPLVRVLSLQFLLTPLAIVSEVQLQRALDFKKRSIVDLTTAVITSLVTLTLALMGHGVWSLALGQVAAAIWRTALVNIVSPFPHWPLFSWTGMRDLMTFGGKVTTSRFLWFFFSQVDIVIVGRMLGGQVLGLYAVAMHLASMPTQRVSAILNQVAFPAFARFQHDREAIVRQLLKAFELVSLIAFPVLWGMAATASDIILVFLGDHWEEAVFPLQVLALIMPFRTVVQFMPTVTDAVGHPGVSLQNGIVGCTLMPLAFYAGTHWGITGVALAWAIMYPVVLLINLRRMVAVIGLTVGHVVQRMMPAMISAGVMFAAVTAVQYALRGYADRKLALAVEVSAGALVYLLCSWTVNRATLMDVWRLVRRKG